MIYITGDAHGRPEHIRQIAKYKKVEYIIVCGDFGFLWDDSEEERRDLDDLNAFGIPILFIDGNHENYDLLQSYPVTVWNGGKVQYIRPNILHLMRGQVFTINGYTFFTMGGAQCHDTEDGILDPVDPRFATKLNIFTVRNMRYRIKGISWWPEELPSEAELEEGLHNLEAHGNKVDVILTHCASTPIQSIVGMATYPRNRLTEYFEQLEKTVDFKLWFVGHYHMDTDVTDKHVLLYHGAVQLERTMSHINESERIDQN